MKKHYSRSEKITTGILYFVFAILVICAVFPFIYMMLLSLMETRTMKLTIERLINAKWTIGNYTGILYGNGKFLRYILNSAITSGYSCVVTCLVSSMAAYAFSKRKFPGRDKLYYLFLLSMMIPDQALLIPKFLITKDLGLLNTYTGLTLPCYSAFGVILTRSFMKNLPNDLFEAADIDGCSEVKKFISIVLPLIKPSMISLAIFTFIGVWGNLMWPLVAVSGNMTTVTQAVANMKNGMAVTNCGSQMAATAISFMPPFILYLFLKKQFVEGIALSGIKG